MAVSAAAAQSSTTASGAQEIGVTPKEVHVAVVADVDNSLAPNLFKGDVDAVKGFAKYVNATGGLAGGRKLVVDFYDSKLNANAARDAAIQACTNDLAMVGTSGALLGSATVADMRACTDSSGAVTGIPDLPFVAGTLDQQCSDQSYPLAPPQVVCSTKDQHPQTFQPNIGRAYYYLQKYGKDLHGAYIFGSDSKQNRDASFSSGIGQMRAVGIKSDEDFDLSVFSPQSAYTPVVQSLKTKDSNYVINGSTLDSNLLLRKEAELQGGIPGIKVWDCTTQCYDQRFITDGGAAVDGNYVDLLYLPYLDARETKANKELAAYVKYVGKDNIGQLGAVYSWAAAEAFRQAADAAVKAHGKDGLTRKNLFEALNNIHEFDANGLFGKIDLAGRKTSPCHVLVKVQNGKFVRVQPTKVGTMDCSPKNVKQVKLDLFTG
jgi:ABC-type branched-subunit amino acid transport system substrate-binding protein